MGWRGYGDPCHLCSTYLTVLIRASAREATALSKRSDISDVRNMSFRELESPMDSILNRNKEYGRGAR